MDILERIKKIEEECDEIKKEVSKLSYRPHVGDIVKIKEHDNISGVVLIEPDEYFGGGKWVVMTGANTILACSESDDMVVTEDKFPQIQQVKDFLREKDGIIYV